MQIAFRLESEDCYCPFDLRGGVSSEDLVKKRRRFPRRNFRSSRIGEMNPGRVDEGKFKFPSICASTPASLFSIFNYFEIGLVLIKNRNFSRKSKCCVFVTLSGRMFSLLNFQLVERKTFICWFLKLDERKETFARLES